MDTFAENAFLRPKPKNHSQRRFAAQLLRLERRQRRDVNDDDDDVDRSRHRVVADPGKGRGRLVDDESDVATNSHPLKSCSTISERKTVFVKKKSFQYYFNHFCQTLFLLFDYLFAIFKKISSLVQKMY